jgi:large subunit ribosomal protein L25
MTEIEIECLATQLPEHITVDLSNVTTGSTVHTGDIVLPKGIKLVLHGRTNLTVATLVEPVKEVVAAPVVAAVDDKKKGKGKK